MRRAWGNIADRVLLCLAEQGPGTTCQVAARLGVTQPEVARAVCRMLHPTQRGADAGKRRVHICGWMREPIAGQRAYLRAIYAAGHRHDAARPAALTQSQRNKRRPKKGQQHARA